MFSGNAAVLYDAMVDKFTFTDGELVQFARSLGINRVPWSKLSEYRKDGKVFFPPKNVLEAKVKPSPKPKKVAVPVTNVDMSSFLKEASEPIVQEDDVKQSVEQSAPSVEDEPDEEREEEKQDSSRYRLPMPSNDPKLVDKYDKEVTERHTSNITVGSKIHVYVVQDFDDGYVVGITKSFDTAFDVLRMRVFNDNGECMNKEAAKKKVDKDGFVILKANIGQLKVIIKTMVIE